MLLNYEDFYLGFFPGYGVVLLQFLESLVPNLTLFLIALKYVAVCPVCEQALIFEKS